jgi:hypothetical protein
MIFVILMFSTCYIEDGFGSLIFIYMELFGINIDIAVNIKINLFTGH